jgi:hypothetical protein
MKYESYPTEKDTPRRMTRKNMRGKIFVTNKKMAKAKRKAARKARQLEQGE